MYKINKSYPRAANHLKNGLGYNQIKNSSNFNFIHKPVKKLMVANRGY
jgi:hypothetical protein